MIWNDLEKDEKINLWLNMHEGKGKEVEKLAQKWSKENGIHVNVQIDTINLFYNYLRL